MLLGHWYSSSPAWPGPLLNWRWTQDLPVEVLIMLIPASEDAGGAERTIDDAYGGIPG